MRADGGVSLPPFSGPGDARLRLAVPRQKDLHTGRAGLCRLSELRRAPPFERQEHALDMFAGAEAVDLIIGAAAGIRKAGQIADLDLVDAAAVRRYAKSSEKGLVLFKRLDGGEVEFSAQPGGGRFRPRRSFSSQTLAVFAEPLRLCPSLWALPPFLSLRVPF